MPPAIVPSVARVAEKWARRSASAGQEYTDGVTNTTRSWAAASAAAERNYQAGVTAAAGAGRFGKGVARAGDGKWKANAVAKGPGRFAQGVSVAQADFQSQFAPYLEAIGRIDLPARGPVGSDGNYARVAAIGKALRDLKTRK